MEYGTKKKCVVKKQKSQKKKKKKKKKEKFNLNKKKKKKKLQQMSSAEPSTTGSAASMPSVVPIECDASQLLAMDGARLLPESAFSRKFRLAGADAEPYFNACAQTLLG
jgi:hypothetical protein